MNPRRSQNLAAARAGSVLIIVLWVAFGLVERVCAAFRSISFITDVTSAWSTLGLSGKALLMSSGI